jgi:hypothetical protein
MFDVLVGDPVDVVALTEVGDVPRSVAKSPSAAWAVGKSGR